jgi:hypothetical protein
MSRIKNLKAYECYGCIHQAPNYPPCVLLVPQDAPVPHACPYKDDQQVDWKENKE